jgi:hypothetical protein
MKGDAMHPPIVNFPTGIADPQPKNVMSCHVDVLQTPAEVRPGTSRGGHQNELGRSDHA